MNKLAKSDDSRQLVVNNCSSCGQNHTTVIAGANQFICPTTGDKVFFLDSAKELTRNFNP